MGNVIVAGPSQLYVQWRCRRCGHRHGLARTTVPVTAEWSEPMMRTLLDALRRKLVRKHLAQQRCLAVMDDFELTAYAPRGQSIVERV